MANSLWRANDRLVAYVDDPDVIRKINRSHNDYFTETTQYYQAGACVAHQYNVSPDKVRNARRLLGVNVER